MNMCIAPPYISNLTLVNQRSIKKILKNLPPHIHLSVVVALLILGIFFGQDELLDHIETDTTPASISQTASIEPPSPPTPLPEGQYQIHRVVDGDTARVWVDGESESIRIIGLDTPETVHPRQPVECFGQEASNRAKELLDGQTVGLEIDPTQGDRDTFGRLLRYIILPDGRNFSQVMIEEGYGFEYTFRSNPHTYQTEFQTAQRQARENQRGLWSPDTCNGEATPIE